MVEMVQYTIQAAARKTGLSERQANETENYSSGEIYDDLQQDVLQYAEEVTRNVLNVAVIGGEPTANEFSRNWQYELRGVMCTLSV